MHLIGADVVRLVGLPKRLAVLGAELVEKGALAREATPKAENAKEPRAMKAMRKIKKGLYDDVGPNEVKQEAPPRKPRPKVKKETMPKAKDGGVIIRNSAFAYVTEAELAQLLGGREQLLNAGP